MSQIENTKVQCQFCGNVNEFTKEELYTKNQQGKEIFKEKYCTECGLPLTIKCPKCENIFILEATLKKNKYFKVAKTFWDPTPSPLDILIPKLEKALDQYKELAEKNNLKRFSEDQKDFLKDLPQLKERLTLLTNILNEIKKIKEAPLFEKQIKKIEKEIDKNYESIKKINENRDPQSGIIMVEVGAKIGKYITFTKSIPPIQTLLDAMKKFRQEEIKKEQETFKPGYNKIKDHILQNPQFYYLICPICNENIYVINHKIYLVDKETQKLKYVTQYEVIPEEEEEEKAKNAQFEVIIHIDKGEPVTLHANMTLILQEEKEERIGRDLIRELEFEEDELAEDILYDEDDPLARISREQLKILLRKGKVYIKTIKFDENRPPIYLNSEEEDIRKEQPEEIEINIGDTIILPLTREKENPNKIRLTLKSLT